MAPPAATPVPRPHAAIGGRPAADPACAGCAQLGLFRALRRAGLDVQGRSGCEPEDDRPFSAAQGRWAAVTGARRLARDLGGALSDAESAGARLLVLADREDGESRRAAAILGAVRPVIRIDGTNPGRAEALAREAAGTGAALVALTACARLEARRPPLAIVASRCNRCGACLSLGCPAISDVGGEAMVVDAALCSGCALCAPLCRARALGAP